MPAEAKAYTRWAHGPLQIGGVLCDFVENFGHEDPGPL